MAKKKAAKQKTKKAKKSKAKPAKRKAAKTKPAKKKAAKKATKKATKKVAKKKPAKKKAAKKKSAAKKKAPAKKQATQAPKPKKLSAKQRLEALEKANAALRKQLKAMQSRLDEATGTSPDLSAVLNILSPRMDELHLSQSELRNRQDNLRDHHNHAEARFREWQEGVEAMVARLARGAAPSGSDVAVPAVSIDAGAAAAESTRRPSGGTGHPRYDDLERRIDELLLDTDRVKAQIHGFAELQRILSEMKGEAAVSKQAFQKFLEQSQRSLESELKALVELRSTQTHELVKRVRDRAQKGIEQFEAFLKKSVKAKKR